MRITEAEARSRCIAEYGVSRETADRLDFFVTELLRWQRIRNLVSNGDLAFLWRRHIADSLQLLDLSAEGTWVDLGSGAGFPGLIVAITRPERSVHLIDSDNRKCAFLRHVARQVARNATVHAGRIDDEINRLPEGIKTISARALAPLDQLLAWSAPLIGKGATGLFLKGRDFAAELTRARECWRFDADLIPSRTDSTARIIRISGLWELTHHDRPRRDD